MSSERTNFQLTTALYFGIPVLIGASCYYYYYCNSSRGSDSKKASTNNDKNSTKKLTPAEQLAQWRLSGNQSFTRRDYDAAMSFYTKAIEFSKTLDPPMQPMDLAIFYQNRAACNEALGNYEAVIPDCSRAIELNKTYTKAYIRRAKAYEKFKNYNKAMFDASSAVLLEKFQNHSSMVLFESIVKASSKQKAAEAMKNHIPTWPARQNIKSYFSAFTLDPIKEKLNCQIISNPEQLEPVLAEANKPENDNDPLSLLIRGSCQSLKSDLLTALDTFDKILSLECSARMKANALIKKAAVIVSQGTTGIVSNIEIDVESVHRLLSQAEEMDPSNHDIYLHKAQILTLSEKFDDAINVLNKAIELKNDFFAAIAQRYYIEFKKATINSSLTPSQLEDLLDRLKTSVKENPESEDLLQMYAQVLTELSYFEQADKALSDLNKLDPTDTSVYISRALLQFHIKSDPDDAASLINKALALDPKIMFAYELLGSLATQRGKVDEAIQIFETALKYCQFGLEYERFYNLLDSAICQRSAAEMLGM